ncbi:hypothetical protein MA20_20295 [Bradyrhizobium japonicum]|uniref:Uncharacterized protein n=1 Tax=Bradyrhizobium japonicum TaxID=375 RepID=A0A0A3XXX6_BRAJP|nr:hypothetical protein [Bradyrhizobium japonicum]KGT77981.1 hypothetical protein MA20_20295 [Bradyrhizobium japonicum]
MKSDGHLGRWEGDAANIVFTAVDHNLRLTLSLAEALLRLIRNALLLMLAVALELRRVERPDCLRIEKGCGNASGTRPS